MGDGLPPDLVQLRSTLPIRALVLGVCYSRIFDVRWPERYSGDMSRLVVVTTLADSDFRSGVRTRGIGGGGGT